MLAALSDEGSYTKKCQGMLERGGENRLVVV